MANGTMYADNEKIYSAENMKVGCFRADLFLGEKYDYASSSYYRFRNCFMYWIDKKAVEESLEKDFWYKQKFRL